MADLESIAFRSGYFRLLNRAECEVLIQGTLWNVNPHMFCLIAMLFFPRPSRIIGQIGCSAGGGLYLKRTGIYISIDIGHDVTNVMLLIIGKLDHAFIDQTIVDIKRITRKAIGSMQIRS